jgi:uncharacterized membrane protein YczE
MGKEYFKRWLICMAGLIISGTGTYVCVQAKAIGIGAWETFQTGLSMRTGLIYGTCSVIVSFVIIALDLVLKGKIGIGTLFNAVLIGKTVDFWQLHACFLPAARALPQGILYLLAGQVLVSLGTVVYMSPGLGCGPRDTLMVVLGKKFPKVNIGIVRFCIESCVFVLGILMGAPYGWGTVFAVASMSYVMQAVFKLCRFKARDVQHENLADTWRRWKGRTQTPGA